MSVTTTRWSRDAGRPKPERPPLVAPAEARSAWPEVDATLARGAVEHALARTRASLRRHDIAAALWEAGADVTMVQRSSTHIVRSDPLMESLGPLYSEEAVAKGVTTDRADLIFASIPYRILPEFQIPVYANIREQDADFYAGLEKAGFKLDWGDDDPRSLAVLLDRQGNPDYLGPWAFHTLGGSGGQTVFGALNTGTHGGDFRLPPIADAVMALRQARDLYTRRGEGVSIWVVPSAAITASSPDEKDSFFDPSADKPYRHPTFYEIPEGVKHL